MNKIFKETGEFTFTVQDNIRLRLNSRTIWAVYPSVMTIFFNHSKVTVFIKKPRKKHQIAVLQEGMRMFDTVTYQTEDARRFALCKKYLTKFFGEIPEEIYYKLIK